MNDDFGSKKDIISYRIEKANRTFVEAQDNARLKHWSLAANRLYYALFHMSSAILLDKGIHFKTHAGAIRAIGLHFVTKGLLTSEEGRLISRLQTMRSSGDYDDLFDWTESDVMPMFDQTEALLKKMGSLITSVKV